MRQDYPEFQRRNAEVIAIGTSSLQSFRKQWEKQEVPFPALPDPDKQALDLFGQEFKLRKFGRLPAIVVVDSNGMARFAHYGNSARDIPDNREIFEVLDQINAG